MLSGAFFGDRRDRRDRPVGARPPRGHGRGRRRSRSSTLSSASTCAPTRSSVASRSTSSRSGSTGYLFRSFYGTRGTPELAEEIPDVKLPFIHDIPFIGDIFGQLNLMIWLMFLTVFLSWVVLFKTPLGLRIRSVGEHPRAADTVGISVFKIRYAAVILSGVLAGLGGAYLSFGFGNAFNENMTAGPRLHRAGGGDLRQLAAVRGLRRLSPVRLLERARAAASGLAAPALGPCLRQSPPDPAVRSHARRARGRGRALARPCSCWPSLRQAVARRGFG